MRSRRWVTFGQRASVCSRSHRKLPRRSRTGAAERRRRRQLPAMTPKVGDETRRKHLYRVPLAAEECDGPRERPEQNRRREA